MFIRGSVYSGRLQCVHQCFTHRPANGHIRNVLYDTRPDDQHAESAAAPLASMHTLIDSMLRMSMDELIVRDELEHEVNIVQQAIVCARQCLRDFL